MPNKTVVVVQLTNREIKSIIGSPEKSAQAVDLIYVHDSEKGIKRIKKGHFTYIIKKQRSKIKLF
jgi:hypothetical protein